MMTHLVLALALLGLSLGACGGGAPKIPHALLSQADSSCRSCHTDGINGAARTPHPNYDGCMSCHLPQ